jgi:hypothetical protein
MPFSFVGRDELLHDALPSPRQGKPNPAVGGKVETGVGVTDDRQGRVADRNAAEVGPVERSLWRTWLWQSVPVFGVRIPALFAGGSRRVPAPKVDVEVEMLRTRSDAGWRAGNR